MKMPGTVVLAPDRDTKRSLLGYGSGLSNTPLTTVKTAVAEPMPRANAAMASSATAGAVFQEDQAWEKADSTVAVTVAPSRRRFNWDPGEASNSDRWSPRSLHRSSGAGFWHIDRRLN